MFLKGSRKRSMPVLFIVAVGVLLERAVMLLGVRTSRRLLKLPCRVHASCWNGAPSRVPLPPAAHTGANGAQLLQVTGDG